jgi:hypothetical protein
MVGSSAVGVGGSEDFVMSLEQNRFLAGEIHGKAELCEQQLCRRYLI